MINNQLKEEDLENSKYIEKKSLIKFLVNKIYLFEL